MTEIFEKAHQMEVVRVGKKYHVITPTDRPLKMKGKKPPPPPDYLGTGKALVAVLRPNETLEDFRAYWIKKRLALMEERYTHFSTIQRKHPNPYTNGK